MSKDDVVETVKEKTGVTLTKEQFDNLMNRLNTLENKESQATSAPLLPQAQGAQVTARGIVGTQEKYPVNKALYADPRERLYAEKRLSRFNLKENYQLYWKVEISRYQTAQGLWMQEPRFELELRWRDINDQGIETRQVQVGKFVGHEDYDAAVDIAMALGIDVDPNFGTEFIDEMRYQQMRIWLEEQRPFFPPNTVENQNSKKHEVVINGTAVTVFENPKDLNRELSGV